MSVQILLQGKLLGLDDFLHSGVGAPDDEIAARSLWISLVCEVLPRALLADLELARLLLGSSGGGQFLVVLPDLARPAAETFLADCARRIDKATRARIRLVWAITENLGDWTAVRKRLADEMSRRVSAPLADARSFAPFVLEEDQPPTLTGAFGRELQNASSVGWSPDAETLIVPGAGKYTWAVSGHLSLDGITIARHTAPNDADNGPASVRDLASRANGQHLWGVLRGSVDLFDLRIRRLQSVEEHVQLSMLYKHFFAGELEVLCAAGEFWRRVSIFYSGSHDFAVYGSWDALLLFAGEMQRTFHRFGEENLSDFPGAEAKTLSMALALGSGDEALATVVREATGNLALARAVDRDCIYLFGRVVEWKQLADAADLKEAVTRVSDDFKSAGKQFLSELTRLYGKASSVGESAPEQEKLLRHAYRFQRKYSRVAYSKREKEFGKLRQHLIGEIMGRNIRPVSGKQLRLRPAGVVAIEWARLSNEV